MPCPFPWLTANRHNDPVEAETILALEQCDLVGLCRTLVADPDWPNKAAAAHCGKSDAAWL